MSPYNYVRDNPIRNIDPDGMSTEDWLKANGLTQNNLINIYTAPAENSDPAPDPPAPDASLGNVPDISATPSDDGGKKDGGKKGGSKEKGDGENVKERGPTLEDLKSGPPKDPSYKAPKSGDRKVRNPNGTGTGWIDRDGNVWVPTDHKGTNHAPHWDKQLPNGSHENVYPDPKNYRPGESPNNNYVAPGNHPNVSPVAAGLTLGGVLILFGEYGWPLLAL